MHFEQRAQEATFVDYLHEVEHMGARIARLDAEIEEAVKLAPAKTRATSHVPDQEKTLAPS